MKMKKLAVAVSLACAGFALSPATWAAFPQAGVDSVPSLAQFKVTFTKEFAFYLKEVKGAPFCSGYSKPAKCPQSARTYISPKLYEANTKVGRSGPHRDGDDTDEWDGADICKDGDTASCKGFFSWTDEPILDAHFQWKEGGYQADGHPYDEGPKGREEVHTQVVSFKLTPLNSSDHSANAVRAGDQAPCQARSLGEVESLNGDGFPAESFFQMYVDVDVDMNNDGKVDMVLFNQPGIENTIFEGDPLIIESTGLKSFPPKVIYSHTGRSGDKDAPKLFVRGENCKKDPNYVGHVGWLRIATHGISFGPDPSNIKRGVKDGAKPDQCQEGETDDQCFDRVVASLPMMPIPPAEDVPFTECPPDCELVDLESFMAVENAGNIVLGWTTTAEINNAGFHIWRAKKANQGDKVEYTLPDGTSLTEVKRITNQVIPTQGVSHNGGGYSYADSNVTSGNTYYYALEDNEFNGETNLHLELIKSATVQ